MSENCADCKPLKIKAGTAPIHRQPLIMPYIPLRKVKVDFVEGGPADPAVIAQKKCNKAVCDGSCRKEGVTPCAVE